MIKYNFMVSNLLFTIKSEKEIKGMNNLIKHYENSDKTLIKEQIIIIVSEMKNKDYIKYQKNFKKKEKIEYFTEKFLYKYKNKFLFENEKIIVKKLKQKKISLKTISQNASATNLLRLIREYTYRYYEKKGFICFHAAGIKIQKNICMILGASGTGKTTLLCKLAEEYNFPISNDRLLINSKCELQTIPLHYRIGYGTLINSDKLLNFFLKYADNLYKFNILEISKTDVLNRYSDGYFENKKLELTQLEIEQCFNFKEKYKLNKLTHIIIPELTLKEDIFEIKTLGKKEIINILLNEKYTPNDKNWKENWIINPNYSNFNYFDIITNILNEVKIIKVIFSPQKAKDLILYLEENNE